MDNHANVQGYTRSFLNMMPPTIAHYIAINLDTIPKVTKYVLLSMSISNFFLFINSMRATFVTFLAASLLASQTFFVIMVTHNNQISFAPRGMEPTEFMVGLCLGICIGGAILAWFVSVTLVHHWSIWWWSSIICWSNILLTYLIAAGREDITQTQQQQYNSIDTQASSYTGQSPSSFQQVPQMEQPPPPPQQNDQRSYGDFSQPDASNSGAANLMSI